jgi:hypothetical protein
MKKIIAFDLDGTLAVSKQALDDDMARRLRDLLNICPVCVISGGDWPQFKTQVVDRLPAGARLEQLILMPTTGAKYYRFDGEWRQVYAENFSDEQRRRVLDAFKSAIDQAGFAHEHSVNEKLWGNQVEDRGSQITFSALGPSRARNKSRHADRAGRLHEFAPVHDDLPVGWTGVLGERGRMSSANL